jgi:hypothetical protein
VAAEFPQLCEAETQVISRLVGTHVQRLATIANGDGVCTTHIPRRRPLDQPDRDPPARYEPDQDQTDHDQTDHIVRTAR